MISLRERQSRFLALLTDESPSEWDSDGDQNESRISIYRNNYRSALVEALENSYERTARLTGREAFQRAAIHHVIKHQPTSWTIDRVGEGFSETCRDLFANDPEVAEVAWLEWAMSRAFTSRDAKVMTLEDFAKISGPYDELQWAQLTLSFLPSLAIRNARFDLPMLWTSLAEGQKRVEVESSVASQSVLVWRDDERPVFRMISGDEADCIEMAQSGRAFCEICEFLAIDAGPEVGGQRAVAMLREWLVLGLLESVSS